MGKGEGREERESKLLGAIHSLMNFWRRTSGTWMSLGVLLETKHMPSSSVTKILALLFNAVINIALK